MYCTKCGAEIKPEFRFCASCGAQMGAAAGPQVVTTPLDAEARPTWLGKVETGKDVEAAAGGAVIAVLVGAYLWYEGFGPTYMVIFALVAAGLSLKSRPEVVRAAAVAGTVFQGLSCLFLVVAVFHGRRNPCVIAALLRARESVQP